MTNHRPPTTDHQPPTTSIIVAMADNNVIGLRNDIPWYIPEDLQYFKKVTMGKPCIMGRKTYESILARLGKPLPGRTSIVISSSGYTHDDAVVVSSLETAIEKARKIALKDGVEEIMVIGGAQIYALALPHANRLYITRVHDTPEGDAFFPPFDEQSFETATWDDRGEFSFVVLEK